jgi:hypothetical protein
MSLAGDMNRDSAIDGLDVPPFVRVLIDGPATVTERCGADVTGDAFVTLDDADAFVAALLN